MQKRKLSDRVTFWVGSPASLVVHTLFFAVMFALVFVGVPFDKILLILTTVVSLEAIYLAIFIQIAVNENTRSLQSVEEDIDEIQEDIDEIQEDVDEIEKGDEEEEQRDHAHRQALDGIETQLENLITEIERIKRMNMR